MNLLDAIKLANDLADKFRDAELRRVLVDVKLEAVNLAEEVVRLREENLELRTAAKLQEEMTYSGNAYWQRDAQGRPVGPFCPRCWDGNGKVARMSDPGFGYWMCPVCDRATDKPDARRAQPDDFEPPREPI